MTILPLKDDRSVLLQIARDDSSAFGSLFSHFYDQLYSTALMYIKVPEMAEDIVQQVFLKLWERRRSLPDVECLESYLFIATRNEILNSLRQQAVRRRYTDRLKEIFADEPGTPEEFLIGKQQGEIIQQAVGNLSPQQQQAWRLSREKGLCYTEIALQMDIALPTVKSHISGALKSIREFLSIYKGELLSLLIVSFLR